MVVRCYATMRTDIFSLLEQMNLGDLDVEIEGDDLFQILVDLAEKLGLDFDKDSEKETITIHLEVGGVASDVVLYNDPEWEHYGQAIPGTNEIKVNVEKHGTVGDLAATVLHELCHKALEMAEIKGLTDRQEECLILRAQLNAMNSFIDPRVRSPNMINGKYPFSDTYYNDQEKNLELYTPKDKSGSGICVGSAILNLLVLLGLLLRKSLNIHSSRME
jgi:hypothetical protein